MIVDLTGDWKRRHMATAVPGANWDRDRRTWYVADPTPEEATIILRLFPELVREHPELEAMRDQQFENARPQNFANAFDEHILPQLTSTFRNAMTANQLTPYDFQNVDLGYLQHLLEAHGAGGLFWERGLGKTLGAAALIDATQAKRTLVIAPNTSKRPVWENWLRRLLPRHEIQVLPNAKVKREALLDYVADWKLTVEPEGQPLVLVVHYEALALIAGTEKYSTKGGKRKTRIGAGWARFGEWDLVVADEAHRLVNTDSQMHRAAKSIPRRRFVPATGSFIQNRPEEPFAHLTLMFPGIYKRKWQDWNDRFVKYVDDGFGKRAVGFKPAALDELRRELGQVLVYRRKSDEIDLPPRTDETLLLDLRPEQRRIYDDMLNKFWAELEDGSVIGADNVLAQLNQLRKIATLVPGSDSIKLDTAMDIITDNEDEHHVVFSWYKAPLAELAQRLEQRGVSYEHVDGDVPSAARDAAIRRFMDGEARVFLGTIATLGESVNLQRASSAIFLDRSWNPAANDQAEDRIYRLGQTRPVTVTHLVARDTVDELRVLPTLASKEALRRAVIGR